jgi:hypothetical protein
MKETWIINKMVENCKKARVFIKAKSKEKILKRSKD